MGEQVIVLTDLTKQYGNFTAVDHIRLHIQKGEIFGLLGPNGAGKSTTILMMLGLTEPTSGSVEICGINSTTHPIEVKRKIGYLPEDVGFYDDMTGLENLIYTARLNGIPDKEAREKAMELIKRTGLEDQLKKKAGKYSRGAWWLVDRSKGCLRSLMVRMNRNPQNTPGRYTIGGRPLDRTMSLTLKLPVAR